MVPQSLGNIGFMTQNPIENLLTSLPLPALIIGRDTRIAGQNAAVRAMFPAAAQGQHFATALRQPELITAIERCNHDHDPQTASFVMRGDSSRDISFVATVAWLDLADIQGVLVTFDCEEDSECSGWEICARARLPSPPR